jgi:Bifunctional DNA primase/polymerase, N-terminal/Primase C terminal 1 (PriCT-1)
MSTGAFFNHAQSLRALGLAVIPITGKRPLVGNFNKWNSPPSYKYIEAMRAKFAEADVAIVAGPSMLVIVDVDDMAMDHEAERLFGPTPVMVRSARGRHRYYKAKGAVASRNLRAARYGLGLDIDIKAGSGYVKAPPSTHDSGWVYALESGDWSTLGRLPYFDDSNLMQGRAERVQLPPPPTDPGRHNLTDGVIREGNRRTTLNNRLCALQGNCHTFDELMAVAYEINNQFDPPLADDEMVRTATAIWKDKQAGKLKPWADPLHGASRENVEMKAMLTACNGDCRAHTFLQLLRTEHAFRSAFVLKVKSMIEAKPPTMPHWSRRDFERAVDDLMRLGYIRKIVNAELYVSDHKCTLRCAGYQHYELVEQPAA